ncbi:MAG: hypothetical protein Q9191_003443 [Dirinaria sp. TL-2023a]
MGVGWAEFTSNGRRMRHLKPALRQEIHESLTSSQSSHLDRDAHLHSIFRLKDQVPAQDRPFTGVRSMGPDLHRREREDKVKSVVDDIRVLKSALRTTKQCLGRQLSLAERVIERAAIYEARLAGSEKRGNEEQLHHSRHLSQEYFVLRITLAWRQDRLDLAELMVPKVYLDSTEKDPSTAESIADLYYEIGRDQINKSRPAEATKWLARAQEVLSSQDLEELSSDSSELQVSVMHSLIKALISLGGQEHIAKAWNILGELELEHGDRLAVSLLRLDLYSLDPVYPAQDYCDVLQKIVRTVHLTDSNVKTALHHIHKLRTRNARMAHMVLVTLAIERLAGVEEYQWLEKTLITLIWNCTTSAELTDTFGLLSDFLETLQGNIGRAISPSATHAAQILILCALGGSDPQRARDVYLEMSGTNQKHPSTQYLLYKIALRCQDVELGIWLILIRLCKH